MSNVIQQWIDNDEGLTELITEIQNKFSPPNDQAKEAFFLISEHYDLPVMPEDKERYWSYYENHKIESPRSVFEEHAVLRFLAPEDDPRGRVLSAIFHVKNNISVDYKHVAEKQFGKKIPQDLLIGIRGEGLNGEIVFPLLEGKTWTELGCVVCSKLVSI